MLGSHEQILPLRELGVFPESREVRAARAIHLRGPGAQLFEDLERDVDRGRGQRGEHEVAHGGIERRAGNPLTHRLRRFDPSALTDILRRRMPMNHAVPDRHPLPTPAADPEPLEQGHALTRRASTPVPPVAVGVVAQRRLIGLEVFP